MLKSLQLGKATGPDAINNRVLKELAKPLSFPLSDLFNFSLTSGKVPLIWKEANVTPIFKKDDPSVVSNYRPISLLSTVGKVLEKIVHKHLFNFIRDIVRPANRDWACQTERCHTLSNKTSIQ